MTLPENFTLILLVVLGLAVAFDYINGFHDTANAIATSVSTRALRPSHAILMSAAANFLGALTGTAVAKTIASGIATTPSGDDGQIVVAAALIGVAGLDPALPVDDEGVGGTDPSGLGARGIGQGQRRLLMRQGDVGAPKAQDRQGAEGPFELLGPHRQRHIGAVDPMLRQPIAIEPGRERMTDRPAHHAGQAGLSGDGRIGLGGIGRGAGHAGTRP